MEDERAPKRPRIDNNVDEESEPNKEEEFLKESSEKLKTMDLDPAIPKPETSGIPTLQQRPEFVLEQKFDFKKLPETALRKICENLSFMDKSSLMTLDSWFHWRVSSLCPQKMKLGKFKINIADNEAQISSHIIAQECYKDMKQVLDEYKAVISRLAFTNTGKEMFLLEPENNLPNLTKLVLQHLENNSGTFCESPCILVDVKDEEVVCLGSGLIQLYAENLTSLKLYRPLMPDDYHIPNLKYFSVPRDNGNILPYANFIRTNAATLEVMSVGVLRASVEPHWPEFPKLKQLSLVYSDIVSILPRDLIKNATKLEFLYVYGLNGDIEDIFDEENDLSNVKLVLLNEHSHTKAELDIFEKALPNAEISCVQRRSRRLMIENRGKKLGYNPAFLNQLSAFLH